MLNTNEDSKMATYHRTDNSRSLLLILLFLMMLNLLFVNKSLSFH